MPALSGIRPDLVTYGKVIGGGFPVGAYGGRRELMELVAPAGPVYQAGTLSANPLAMCAGLATLQRLADGSVYRRLEAAGRAAGARARRGAAGWPCSASARCSGSAFAEPAPPATPMRTLHGLPGRCRPRASHRCFIALLERGIYLAPSAFEVGFLSAAHTEAHVDALAQALLAHAARLI